MGARGPLRNPTAYDSGRWKSDAPLASYADYTDSRGGPEPHPPCRLREVGHGLTGCERGDIILGLSPWNAGRRSEPRARRVECGGSRRAVTGGGALGAALWQT